ADRSRLKRPATLRFKTGSRTRQSGSDRRRKRRTPCRVRQVWQDALQPSPRANLSGGDPCDPTSPATSDHRRPEARLDSRAKVVPHIPVSEAGDQRDLFRQLFGVFARDAVSAVHRGDAGAYGCPRALRRPARGDLEVGREVVAQPTAGSRHEELPAGTAYETGPDEHVRVDRESRALSGS